MHSGYDVQYGRGHQHLVAGVAQHLERVVHGVLAAVRDHDLGRGAVDAGVALGLVGDRFAQLRQTRRGRVVVETGLPARRDRGFDDVLGRREVGLPRAEADHVLAGRLQGLGPGVHGERCRLLDGGDPAGDAFHASMVARARGVRNPHCGTYPA